MKWKTESIAKKRMKRKRTRKSPFLVGAARRGCTTLAGESPAQVIAKKL